MFYLFGFERPPPMASLFVKISLLVALLMLGKLANARDENDKNDSVSGAGSDDDDGGDEDDDEDDDDELFIELFDPMRDKVSSSYDLYRLKRRLLLNYDRDTRPLYNSNEFVVVYVKIKLVQINHLDEVLQVNNFQI